MLYVIIVIGILYCGILAVRSTRLINATLWLAGSSALLATLLFGLGAYQLAVIELSVGAGLVTVLFVFAISVASDEPNRQGAGVPRLLVLTLIVTFVLLLILFALPLIGISSSITDSSFTETVWHERSLDLLLQVSLIFTSALTVLGLLAQHSEASKPLLTTAVITEENRERTP